jgi:hypothetical protein
MLRKNYITILKIRLKALIDLHTPAPLFESCILSLTLLQCSRMFPPRKKSGTDLLMKTIVDGDFVRSCSFDHFFEMGYGVCVFETFGNKAMHLARGMKKIVVGVDNYDGCVGWDGHDCCNR